MINMTSYLVDDVVLFLFPLLNYALNLERIVINMTLDLYDVIKKLYLVVDDEALLPLRRLRLILSMTP